MNRRLLALGGLLAVMVWALPAMASLVEALSMGELVGRADHVVVGTVTHQQARWDAQGRIVTDVTLTIERSLKGDREAGDDLVVRTLGGAIGELGMRIEGEPQFENEVRYMVFAAYRGGELRPVGMAQGVMPVQRQASGETMVLPGGAGMALVRDSAGQLVPAPPAVLHPRALGEVLGEVQSILTRTPSAHREAR